MGAFSRGVFKKKNKSLDDKIRDNDYLGKFVVCEDDVFRPVYNVSTPVITDKSQYWKKGLLIINEGDPKEPMGHWVTILALECALNGDPQPNKEQRKAWIRVASQIETVNLKDIHQQQRQGKLSLDFSE
jgi:hypothetical protein